MLLNFEGCFIVDVEGRSGGLAVLWKRNTFCSILNYTRNFINVSVKENVKGDWRLTCYYGYPKRSRRRQAWDLLRQIHDMANDPWCVIGDFNDILSQEDKLGRHPHPNWLCNGFRQAVSDCNLVDSPLEGHQITWVKSRGTDHAIEERLDHAMVSSNWFAQFSNVKLRCLLATHSDHSPLLINFGTNGLLRRILRKLCTQWNRSSRMAYVKELARLLDVMERSHGALRHWYINHIL